MEASSPLQAAECAEFVRKSLPAGGLFAGHDWRIAPQPFPLTAQLVDEIQSLGRVFLEFYRAMNLLHRRSREGKAPSWVAEWLDQGKPADLLTLQSAPAFKGALPRVIRPDLLLTDEGLALTELDSVPGGIGLTGWLNEVYTRLHGNQAVIGGQSGMLDGFAGIFGDSPRVHIVVSEESATYRPEMEWLAARLGAERFAVRDTAFMDFQPGEAVYRFFELFDIPNIANARMIFEMAAEKRLFLTPPPKPLFEEKIWLALLWNRNLQPFWRQELGEGFLQRLQKITPYGWVVDPSPLPPQGAIPGLNLTDWRQLKELSQRQRALALKVSGFSPEAYGARGVYLGSDMSQADWSEAVERAISSFGTSPYVLQVYKKPAALQTCYYDFDKNCAVQMAVRARLCPYYFVHGDGGQARVKLGGVLATLCPADKKIIHGMKSAIIAPCGTAPDAEKS